MDLKKDEWIICPALWIDDGEIHANQPENIETGYVVYGNHIADIFFRMTNRKTGKPVNLKEQKLNRVHEGYYTNFNRFIEGLIDH
ncbi:MAG: hypothetical protein JXR52_11350 [Bacteroidales bacterium]|nr:hypothetical protein [Bacteroidales bacterium]